MSNISGTPTFNPTLILKGQDMATSPTLEFINEDSFKSFAPTGISVKVSTPLVKNSSNALFAINPDGFIPSYIFRENAWWQVYKNLFPVQNFEQTLGSVKIFQDQFMNPHQMNFLSHRFIRGNVKLCLRVTSNTSQSGTFAISQASGVQRRWYGSNEDFKGLSFLNSANGALDYAPGSFILFDASLNRNIAITPVRKDPLEKMDLVQKLDQLRGLSAPTAANRNLHNVISSQFTEDWIMIGCLGDLPGSGPGEITFTLFYDYSGMSFVMPIFPIIPSAPHTFSKQILRVTDTMSQVGVPQNKANALFIALTSILSEENKSKTTPPAKKPLL